MSHGKKKLVKNGHIITVLHFDLINWYVDVVAQTGTTAGVVVIRFSQIRPESALHVGMNREIQNSKKKGKKQIKTKLINI